MVPTYFQFGSLPIVSWPTRLLFFALSVFLLPCLAGAQVAPADVATSRRVALVIGNAAYQHAGMLSNPANDANDVAAYFESVGYHVIKGLDLDKAGMDRTIRNFARALQKADVGVFFYAGHGLQVGRQNYLVPIDARLEDETGLDFEMVRLDLVHKTMERETKTNILFLDACRDNPLSRNLARAMGTRSPSIGQGLAPVQSGHGTLIAYSTQPDNVAVDGAGRNSPFTDAFVKRAKVAEGVDLSAVLIDVRNDVMAATNNKQVPWEHSALTARFHLAPEISKPKPQNYDREMELVFWNSMKDGNDIDLLKGYLDRFPNGVFVPIAQKRIALLEAEARRAEKARVAEEEQRAAMARAEELKRIAAEAERDRRAREAQAKAETDAAARKSVEEQARLAEEKARKAEEQRVAELKAAEVEMAKLAEAQAAQRQSEKVAAAAPPSAPSPPDAPLDPQALVRAVQTELQRVGCYAGAVDGQWGAMGKAALGRYKDLSAAKLGSDEPTPELLRLLSGQKDRVCPLTCGPNQIAASGKCVPRPVEPRAAAKPPAPDKKPNIRFCDNLKVGSICVD